MVNKVKIVSFYCCLFGSMLVLLSSCGGRFGAEGRGAVQKTVKPLECIAILPATTFVGSDKTIDYAKAQSLEKGAIYASQVLRQELQGHPKVKILTSHQLSSLATEVSGGISGTVTALAREMNCQGVMQTTVSRFEQREGTEYSVESPAAVELLMLIRDGNSGRILWSGDFREKQQSYLSNVLSFSKAQNRGFKWVTAERLMEQGIQKRLADCPYLPKKN